VLLWRCTAPEIILKRQREFATILKATSGCDRIFGFGRGSLMKPFAIHCLVFLSILFGSSPCSAKPHYVRQTPGVDSVIVFIHGVLGSGDTTWKNDNGMYWPSMLAQDETFKDFDIYVHDYPMANHLTIVKPAGPSDIPYLAFKSAVKSVPRKASSCAPVLDNGSISSVCNLTRDAAKSRTIDTVSQVNNKLALILSQKEMYLFPAIEDYLRDPSESKWKRVQTEAVGVLKLVREAGDGVLQFDASLRPELGPG
jgi:hypothetical protein